MDFKSELESKITKQLHSQRVGYLLGAGSSYLEGKGYPLSFELWNKIKNCIKDSARRDEIQAKIDKPGTKGLENALNLLDGGDPVEGEHRHLVRDAIADLFITLTPPLDTHIRFVRQLATQSEYNVKIFSLNYDPLIERAADFADVRLTDGFTGYEYLYFNPAVFEERIGRVRGTHKGRQFIETARPIHLFKLHGSIGWYHFVSCGIRRYGFGGSIPQNAKRLMIPPQKRKADDTMTQPYQALWSAFRGALGQDQNPLNRLVCIGYGFSDEHVNILIENALARTDFTLLIFTKHLADDAWNRWSAKYNVIIVTETRCAIKGKTGKGHPDLWKFEDIIKRMDISNAK